MVHAWSHDAATSISQEARWDKNRDVLTSTVRQLEFIKVLLTRVPHASNLVTLYCIIILLLYYYSIIILFLYYLITYHIRTWRPPWMHPNPILRNALMIRLSGSMDSRLLFVFVPLCLLIVCVRLSSDLLVAFVVDCYPVVVFFGMYAWFWYCAAQPPPGYDPYQEPWDDTDHWYNEC